MRSQEEIIAEYKRLKVQHDKIQNSKKGRRLSHSENMASFEILTCMATLNYVFGFHDDVPLAYAFDSIDERVYLKKEREVEALEVEALEVETLEVKHPEDTGKARGLVQC